MKEDNNIDNNINNNNTVNNINNNNSNINSDNIINNNNSNINNIKKKLFTENLTITSVNSSQQLDSDIVNNFRESISSIVITFVVVMYGTIGLIFNSNYLQLFKENLRSFYCKDKICGFLLGNLFGLLNFYSVKRLIMDRFLEHLICTIVLVPFCVLNLIFCVFFDDLRIFRFFYLSTAIYSIFNRLFRRSLDNRNQLKQVSKKLSYKLKTVRLARKKNLVITLPIMFILLNITRIMRQIVYSTTKINDTIFNNHYNNINNTNINNNSEVISVAVYSSFFADFYVLQLAYLLFFLFHSSDTILKSRLSYFDVIFYSLAVLLVTSFLPFIVPFMFFKILGIVFNNINIYLILTLYTIVGCSFSIFLSLKCVLHFVFLKPLRDVVNEAFTIFYSEESLIEVFFEGQVNILYCFFMIITRTLIYTGFRIFGAEKMFLEGLDAGIGIFNAVLMFEVAKINYSVFVK